MDWHEVLELVQHKNLERRDQYIASLSRAKAPSNEKSKTHKEHE
jgi:hypothetical protein